ncbi:putative ribonuclease H protein At1g65750 family [Senna tora]|uniref:Putative ribonuclease H protein At1g65750 family n=1 Tax=Senna tora TaxID=362788 RepID=A0A834T1H8_9FABA|nr:putative ribonuclease H protein At1g65750 family [Senna tora]
MISWERKEDGGVLEWRRMSGEVHELHPCANLVTAIHHLLARHRDVQVCHVLREANYVVDFLASCSPHDSLDLVRFDQPPAGALPLLLANATGVGTPINLVA